MEAYTYLKNHVFVKLKPSKISGVGVFAIKDIPCDTELFNVWEGETGFYPISQKELDSLDYDLQEHIRDLFLFSTEFPSDTNLYIKLTKGCHWIYTNPYYFINSGFYENNFNVDKESMKSTKNIRRGEELLSNYQKHEKIDKRFYDSVNKII
jgi:hypothetical protein